MEINYDEILSKTIDEEEINYGIIYGNEKIVFIKVGADGNIRGYKCKYLKMACKVHESLGATVLCASNPFIEQGHLEADEAIITKIASQINCCDYEVYFVGTSDGAHHNLALAKKVPQTVKILSINTSMVDLQDLKDRLYELPKIKKILVYGTIRDFFDKDYIRRHDAMMIEKNVLHDEGQSEKYIQTAKQLSWIDREECVYGCGYYDRVINHQSIVVFLRKERNVSYVTIEFDYETFDVLQAYGKYNKKINRNLYQYIVHLGKRLRYEKLSQQ